MQASWNEGSSIENQATYIYIYPWKGTRKIAAVVLLTQASQHMERRIDTTFKVVVLRYERKSFGS